MSAYIRAKQWGKPRKFYRNYWGKPHMKRKVYTRVAKKARKLMGWKKGGARRRRRTRKKRGGEIQKLTATDMMRNSSTILGHKINEIIDDVNELTKPPPSKPPKSAMKTSGGRKRKSRKKRGGVTIYDLGRNFNKNDFKVGQKIDMKMTATSDPLTNLIILEVDDEEITYTNSALQQFYFHPRFPADYRDIYSVRYHEMAKRPKSARKTGKRDDGGGNNFDTMGLGRLFSQSGGKRTRKKRGGGGYEERLFFTTMVGDEFSLNPVIISSHLCTRRI